MINLTEFIFDDRRGSNRRPAPKKVDNIMVKFNEDEFYYILNALHYQYWNDDDIERYDKTTLANIFKNVWQAGKDANVNIHPAYPNDDIKKVDHQAVTDEDEY